MPDIAHLAAFLAAACLLAAIPGPGMLYVLARTLGDGRTAGVRATLGTAAGGSVHVAAASIGLSALLMTSATAFAVVKLAGAAYLIVLGLDALLRGHRGDAVAPPAKAKRAFAQGVLTETLNPKTALFFLTFLPQFVEPAAGPVAVQLAVLGCMTVVLNCSSDAVVVVLGASLRRMMERHPRMWRRQRLASGAILLGVGAYAATGQRA